VSIVSAESRLPFWAQRLTKLRRARAWSPADLACQLKKLRDGLPSVQSLAHMIQMDWETGRHRPGPRYRLLLAAVYETDEKQIFASEPAIDVSSQRMHDPDGDASELAAKLDLADATTWITATGTSDAAIEHIERVAADLAQMHTRAPDRTILASVRQLHRATQVLLRGGPLRLRQARELARLNGEILAYASVLLSNLDEYQAAESHGQAALLYLHEASASQAKACYALAKTARWQHHYAEAAGFARQGIGPGQATAMGVQLAGYEANAAALMGDKARALQTLARAELFAGQLPPGDADLSPWSFPRARLSIFQLSVLLRTGDPSGALRAARAAEDDWAVGSLRNPCTWAQVRIGAAIACLRQGSLDGAAEQVTPLLDLAPDMRISTVTGWLTELDRELAKPRFAASPAVGDLRQQIHEFTTGAPQGAR
jgi:transcriptional regulator with XRE-family HTH domain